MLKHPERRENLIVFLTDLAAYPYRTLIQNDNAILNLDLNDIIHFLFDDTELAYNTHSEIGWFLKSVEEAEAIHELANIINILLNKYGTYLLDTEYIEKPEWQDVVAAAKNALNIIG
ncbi:hypothetical protein MMP66_05595 [Acinetobacter dispersus]|uniref:SCO4402 family protein n=1 Tax=Acinetobacter dispersus TaxID=70348 RepID=UPI001F4A1EEB|nr:hypothetical protein [Acinetobacter dispersus]MCH7393755.1 hypothetical protein [Acinetobacter dispersus]